MSGKRETIFIFGILLLLIASAFSGCLGGNNPETDENNAPENRVVRGATFYIDDFNETKASNEETVKILADIIRRFDVIGLQGINDPDETAMKILIAEINNGTHENGTPYNYQYNLSDPVGNSACCEEQYAYVYDRDVLYPSSSPRIYEDPENNFNRNPYLIAFRAYEGQGQVLFILVTLDENNTKAEINALPALIEDIKKSYTGHENITIVGNLYSDTPYYDENSDSPLRAEEYVWIITNDMITSTKGDYTYDRIIATANLRGSYAGKAGVFNFSEEYGLNKTETEAISTHYPVYVEYWTYPPNT